MDKMKDFFYKNIRKDDREFVTFKDGSIYPIVEISDDYLPEISDIIEYTRKEREMWTVDETVKLKAFLDDKIEEIITEFLSDFKTAIEDFIDIEIGEMSLKNDTINFPIRFMEIDTFFKNKEDGEFELRKDPVIAINTFVKEYFVNATKRIYNKYIG